MYNSSGAIVRPPEPISQAALHLHGHLMPSSGIYLKKKKDFSKWDFSKQFAKPEMFFPCWTSQTCNQVSGRKIYAGEQAVKVSGYLLTLTFLKHVSHFNDPVLQQGEEKIAGLANNDVKLLSKLSPPPSCSPARHYKVRAKSKVT